MTSWSHHISQGMPSSSSSSSSFFKKRERTVESLSKMNIISNGREILYLLGHLKMWERGGFPGGPVVGTACSHC